MNPNASPESKAANAANAVTPAQAWLQRLDLAGGSRALQRRFDQCAPRERLLMLGAAAAVALMLADWLWLSPALNQLHAARRDRSAAHSQIEALVSENRSTSDRARGQLQQHQAELRQWRARVQAGDANLRRHEDSLVGADRMLDLLSKILARSGQVRVRAMTSLGRSDLLNPKLPGAAGLAAQATLTGVSPAASPANASANAGANASANAGATTVASAPPPTLYRHGVELVLEGGYVELTQALKALEALPQHMLWGSLALRVERHPLSTLTVRVYTLSRDRHWLEI